MSDGPLIVVDLFAGAGGLSTGVAKACEDLNLEPGEDLELHAVNHWKPAIRTHEENHGWANHYHARIEELYPPNVVDPGSVTLLTGGPECTHFSNARGGKPVSDQKRASAWHVLDWIEKLRPEHVLLENVKEFRSWGPIDEDGNPTKDGSIFERWISTLEALGYSVVYDEKDEDYGVVLNAADYGDPQSRERLFIMASRSKLPTEPPRTRSDDDDDDLPPRRPAADIIDWSDLGHSLWTRDLENPRVTPLAKGTMARIAEGIRRHCSDRLAPFADVLEQIGPDELEALRETVVPAEYASTVADVVDEPFLVHVPGGSPRLATPSVIKYYGTSTTTPVDAPIDTVTADGNHHAVSTPETYLLRQQSGGVPVSILDPVSTVSTKGAIGMATVESKTLLQPRNGQYGEPAIAFDPEERPMRTIIAGDPRQGHLVTPSLVRYSHGGAALPVDDPMPTVATEKGGTFALSQPYLCPLYNERAGQRPRTRRIDRPLMTVPASKGAPAGIAMPFIDDFQGPPKPIDSPLNTQHANDRFALCIPEEWPWGLDVRYRMLQPDELKQAQGFPEDYHITGSSKKTRTAQIGNAVPVNLARSLARHLLADETPSLTNFGGGIMPDPEIEVPAYEEVAESDD
ncbi:C-5 cytosine-specific DNA methylase [Halobacterium phage phiH]|uniref:DNA (cytosine-5-)-methyltransferase n=2 Tax=Halobacterium phage phiH TaxID=169684 RepID=A0A3G1ZL30_BPPHH|nr:DNA methyltransferase [Halobacterium phage phiH]AYM00327.1 C-5 cytosine-specific DNA methylase [Halobacterium phage phiH]